MLRADEVKMHNNNNSNSTNNSNNTDSNSNSNNNRHNTPFLLEGSKHSAFGDVGCVPWQVTSLARS